MLLLRLVAPRIGPAETCRQSSTRGLYALRIYRVFEAIGSNYFAICGDDPHLQDVCGIYVTY